MQACIKGHLTQVCSGRTPDLGWRDGWEEAESTLGEVWVMQKCRSPVPVGGHACGFVRPIWEGGKMNSAWESKNT